jgi:thiol-disulfide isomerase/thioredoxin
VQAEIRTAREATKRRSTLISWSRIPDLLALALILFVVFKLFVAPRLFVHRLEPAPQLALPTMTGGSFSLTAHRGRLVFIDFWASWCEPCQRSLPLVERFARAHPEVEVLAVDVGEPAEIARRFARRHGLHNVAFDQTQRAAAAFGVNGLPTMVVVDPAGYLRGTWPGYNPAIEARMESAERALDVARPPAAS